MIFFFQTNEQECESIYERPPIWLMLIDITGNVLCEIFAKKIKIE